MKIAIESSALEREQTGVSRTIVDLYRKVLFHKKDVELTFFSKNNIKSKIDYKHNNINLLQSVSNSYWKYLAGIQLGVGGKYDVIHFTFNTGFSIFDDNVLKILTIHDVIPLIFPNVYFKNYFEKLKYEAQLKLSAKFADVIITVSESSKRDIIKFLQPTIEPTVIYNGLSLDFDNDTEKELSLFRENYFLYVGGYDKRKGIEILVNTHRELFVEGKTKSKLYLTGLKREDISPTFKQSLHNSISSGALVELNFVDDSNLKILMKNAVALVYPTMYEGFGLPALEAMALGCPVITTNSSSLPEICGDAAIYINVDNVTELGKSMISIENSPSLRQDLIEKGLKRSKFFSWTDSADKYLQTIFNAKKIKDKF